MAKNNTKVTARIESGVIEVKSKFEAEFRRFSLNRSENSKFAEFYQLLETVHSMGDDPFIICYTDPKDNDLLPINNDDNFHRALITAKPMLRLLIQRKGDSHTDYSGYGTITSRKKNPLAKVMGKEPKPASHLQISQPEDFRRVSAIIDVDIVPESHRRVRLMKNGTEKPLGFYIRDGFSVRVTTRGLEKVPGIFISRLIPGGLAESTGLLAVNDEVLEVNGIEVSGKTLDQVTDMMVANSANLIITVKPVNQYNNISPKRVGSGYSSRSRESGAASMASGYSLGSDDIHDLEEVDEEEEDTVHNHLGKDGKHATKSTDNKENELDSITNKSDKTDSSEKLNMPEADSVQKLQNQIPMQDSNSNEKLPGFASNSESSSLKRNGDLREEGSGNVNAGLTTEASDDVVAL